MIIKQIKKLKEEEIRIEEITSFKVSNENQSSIYSKRQVYFTKDSQAQLIKKFYNKDYFICKELIVREIVGKYRNAEQQIRKLNRYYFIDSYNSKRLRGLNIKVNKYGEFLEKTSYKYLVA